MTAAATSIRSLRAPRWMVVTLVCSLALNLVVVGATASFLWRHRSEPREARATHLPPTLLGYTRTLPAERVKELDSRTEEERRNVGPFRRALREARDESLKALSAEPFDQQRYLAAQSRLLVADQRSREAVLKLYGEIAISLTPEERRGFLRWREERRRQQNLLDEPEKQANETQR